ncbi:hypothetical protein D3C87_1902210 [compost metagenome]
MQEQQPELAQSLEQLVSQPQVLFQQELQEQQPVLLQASYQQQICFEKQSLLTTPNK